MSAFVIRAATHDDAGRLAQFAARTFSDTFAAGNTGADMDAHLRVAYSPEKQRLEIESAQIRTLVGERESDLCAYAQLREGQTPGCVPPSSTIELWRFYVDKAEIGGGSAHLLMAAVLDEAEHCHVDSIWLGVWERNLRAIAFYRKFAFQSVGSHVFRLGSDDQTDLILYRRLQA